MKRFYSTVLILCAFFLIYNPVFSEKKYDGKQIILSWTGENAHTQTVTWHSDSGKEGYIQFNEKGRELSSEHQVKAKFTKITKKNENYYRYEGRIKGLHQNTQYDYRVGDGTVWSQIKSFTTAPAEKDDDIERSDDYAPFEFIYLGDVQYKNKNADYNAWGKFISDAKTRHPKIAFGITGGDMVNCAGSISEWNLFFKNAAKVFSEIPLMTTVGNHELGSNNGFYPQIVAMPQNGPANAKETIYSFNYGDAHFTILDSTFFTKEYRQKTGDKWEAQKEEINSWLEEDLSNSTAKWKIVAMHHPTYGIYDSDAISREIRKNWEPALIGNKVDLVLCGHQHIYMRTKEIKGITYVMGNSGERRSAYYDGENFPDYGDALDATNNNYQIIKVSKKKLTMTSYEEAGQVIDKWTKKDNYFTRNKIVALTLILFTVLVAMLVRTFWSRRGT